MLYELKVLSEGFGREYVDDVINAVGAAVDPLPYVDYHFTRVDWFSTHSIITTCFTVGTDEEEILRVASAKLGTTPEELRAEAEALVIPPAVYAIVKLILAAIIVLGIAYITWSLFVKRPEMGWAIIGVLAIFSIGYLITAVKK